jgi:DnaJ-class molecular chaperone
LGNSDEICNDFFGTTHFNKNSFDQDGSDLFGSLLADSFNGKVMPKKKAPSNVEVTVFCTIAEFFNGSMKQVMYNRTKIGLDGRTYNTVTEYQDVQVKPGDAHNSQFTFRGKGNEEYGHPRSDLIIKLV